MTHLDNVFVPRNLKIWPFDPKINEVPGLMVELMYIKFSNPVALFLEISCGEKTDKQTDKHKNAAKNPTQTTTVDIEPLAR